MKRSLFAIFVGIVVMIVANDGFELLFWTPFLEAIRNFRVLITLDVAEQRFLLAATFAAVLCAGYLARRSLGKEADNKSYVKGALIITSAYFLVSVVVLITRQEGIKALYSPLHLLIADTAVYLGVTMAETLGKRPTWMGSIAAGLIGVGLFQTVQDWVGPQTMLLGFKAAGIYFVAAGCCGALLAWISEIARVWTAVVFATLLLPSMLLLVGSLVNSAPASVLARHGSWEINSLWLAPSVGLIVGATVVKTFAADRR